MLNSISGMAQVLVNIGMVLLTIPVFIRTLGLPTYGIYAVITAIGGVTFLTNFGFSASLIKYLAQQANREESHYDIAVTLLIVGSATCLIASVLIATGDFVLAHVLNLSAAAVTPEVRLLYTTSVVASFFQILGQIPSAVLDSQHRVYISNGIQLIVGFLSKGSIIASLIILPSVTAIAWILLASAIAGTGALTWFAAGIWGRLHCPDLRHRFLPIARKHFSYGRGIYGSMVMGFIYEPMTKVLISRYLGLAQVGYFDIAFRIRTLVWSLIERLLYPILPLIASKPNLADVRRLIEEVERKIIVLIVPGIIATVFLSGPVVRIWLGSDLLPVVVSIIAIVGCYLVALLFVPLYYFLMVKDHPNKTFVLQSVNVGVNITFFALLVPAFNYYGAVAAFCLAVCTSTVLCGWFQWAILKSTPEASKTFWLKVLTLAASLTALNTVITLLAHDPLTRLLLMMFLNGITAPALFRWLRLITSDDVERYVGRQNRFGMVIERLLVQGS
jgi:O-antigen/teichoic acid export membrane protein